MGYYKEFFNCVAKRSRRSPIQALLASNGQLCRDVVTISGIATMYYGNLLSVEPFFVQMRECRDFIWKSVQEVMLPEMNGKLEAPISKEELKKALCALAKNSFPGDDGLLVVFVLEHWEAIGERLKEACNKIFNLEKKASGKER